MSYYENDDQQVIVAQSCRHFSSGGRLSNRTDAEQENISCRVCKNSNGRKCVINAYDNVLMRMEHKL